MSEDPPASRRPAEERVLALYRAIKSDEYADDMAAALLVLASVIADRGDVHDEPVHASRG